MSKLSRFRWPRLTSMPLALEITLVVAVKIAIIFVLRQAFFANPQAKKMVVPAQQIERHFFAGAPSGIAANEADQASGNQSHTEPEKRHGAD